MSFALPSTHETARHEAGHVAMALCLHWTPLYVRVDWPRPDLLGLVELDWNARDIDRSTIVDALLVAIAGPLADSIRGIHFWPIDPDSEDWTGGKTDAAMIAFLVEWLGCDEVDYRFHVHRAMRLMRTRRFKELQVAVTTRLEQVEIVGQPELKSITAQVDQRLARESAA